MLLFRSACLLALVMILSLPGRAQPCVGIPDLDDSIVWMEHEGPCSLVITPAGSGPPLVQARTPAGDVVDATIHLILMNNCPDQAPVAMFPQEDMWLETIGGGVTFCQGGSIADGPTDLEGHTRWSQSLRGGGWDDGNCRVTVNGVRLGPAEGLPLMFNSPDLEGNGNVDLADVYEFAQDYFGAYRYRADLHCDGTVNLADLSVLAHSLGESCP